MFPCHLDLGFLFRDVGGVGIIWHRETRAAVNIEINGVRLTEDPSVPKYDVDTSSLVEVYRATAIMTFPGSGWTAIGPQDGVVPGWGAEPTSFVDRDAVSLPNQRRYYLVTGICP